MSVKCLLRGNGTRNRLKFFYLSIWFCCLPTENEACEHFSSTKCHIQISLDFAFTFNSPSAVIEQLIMNLKPIHFFGTGWITLEDGIRQFSIGNWELRDFLLIWFVRWQNRRDNALLHLLYASLFSIPKMLACLSEAMKLFSSYLFDDWWSHSTPSKRSTNSIAS